MTLAISPGRSGSRRGGIVAGIAERRAADIRAGLGAIDTAALTVAARVAPPPRDLAVVLGRPGLHVIAEIKRRSPSAGAMALDTGAEAVVRRARAYAAGGAAAVSVLCEPHWFGGSLADLRAVRAAVRVPVLAKDFVVDARQLPLLRSAGADAVLLLAVLHPARRLRSLVRQARSLGLEPLVEIHDERELDRALASDARLVGLNDRDLRTLRLDPGRGLRLRARIPDDRLVVAESGVQRADDIIARRARGFDAVLVGEALMRATDPSAAVAALRAAGQRPDDPATRDRRPEVKICGIVDRDGLRAALRAGADAVGLNLVPGTRRALEVHEAAALAAEARAWSPSVRVVLVTADADPATLRHAVDRIDPDAVQLAGDEAPSVAASAPRPAWKVLHLPAADDASADESRDAVIDAVVARGRAYLDEGRCERLLLDTADPRLRGGTGRRADPAIAAAVARHLPVTLSGGLDPANVALALRAIPAAGVDVASGVEARSTRSTKPRDRDRRPRKDPLAIALFAKRARAARDDHPTAATRAAPVHAGLLDADTRGRWGTDRDLGGRWVPETLHSALVRLEHAWMAAREDATYWAELNALLSAYAGRPTPLTRVDRLSADLRAGHSRMPEGSRLYLKREDLLHTGAHKLTNALGQALLARQEGKRRLIAETGAGQHGVATATAAALLGLPCVVYMGALDMGRQRPNVLRMQALGATVRPVHAGTATLKDAINDAMRDWVSDPVGTHYVLGSAMGPHPFPTIVRDLQRVIGDEAAAQVRQREGRLPDVVIACVGGGSNAIGLFSRFIGETRVRIVAVEAAGDGVASGRHAATLRAGSPGIIHGARTLMLQDADGAIAEAHSISAGLDYPGVGPQLAALLAAGRIAVRTATDDEALAAMTRLARTEGILPALEPAHALAALPELLADLAPELPPEPVVLLGLSGRGDKDLGHLERALGATP